MYVHVHIQNSLNKTTYELAQITSSYLNATKALFFVWVQTTLSPFYDMWSQS